MPEVNNTRFAVIDQKSVSKDDLARLNNQANLEAGLKTILRTKLLELNAKRNQAGLPIIDLPTHFTTILVNGMNTARELARHTAGTNLKMKEGQVFFYYELPGPDNQPYPITITPRDLAQLPRQDLDKPKTKPNFNQALGDLWVDADFEQKKSELSPEERSVENLLQSTALEDLTVEQRENYDNLVRQFLHQKKVEILGRYYKERGEDYEAKREEGILAARLAAFEETQRHSLETHMEGIMSHLEAAGIISPEDLPEDLAARLQLLFAVTDFVLGLGTDDEIDIEKMLTTIESSLQGPDRVRNVRAIQYALVNLPNHLVQQGQPLVRITQDGITQTVYTFEIQAAITRKQEQQQGSYEEMTQNLVSLKLIRDKFTQEFPNEKELPPLESMMEKLGKKLGEEQAKSWLQSVRTQAMQITAKGDEGVRLFLQDDEQFSQLQGLKNSPRQIFKQALVDTVEPNLQRAWLADRPEVKAQFTDKAIQEKLKTLPQGERSLEKARDALFQDFFHRFHVDASARPEAAIVPEIAYNDWLETGVNKAIVDTHLKGLKPDAYASLRRELVEQDLLKDDHTLADFAVLATDLLPFLALSGVDAGKKPQSLTLHDTLECFGRFFTNMGDKKDRQRVMQRLSYLQLVAKNIGNEDPLFKQRSFPVHNPFLAVQNKQLMDIPISRIAFTLSPPLQPDQDIATHDRFMFWKDLQQATRVEANPDPESTHALAYYDSPVTIQISPTAQPIIHRQRLVLNQYLFDVLQGKYPEFWQELRSGKLKAESGAVTQREKQEAAANIQSFVDNLIRLQVKNKLSITDIPGLTEGLAVFRNDPKAQDFLQRQYYDALFREVALGFAQGRILDTAPYEAMAKEALGNQATKFHEGFETYFRTTLTDAKQAGLKTQIEQSIFSILSDMQWLTLYENDSSLNSFDDLTVRIRALPFPEQMINDIVEPLVKLREDLLQKLPQQPYQKDLVAFFRELKLIKDEEPRTILEVLRQIGEAVCHVQSIKSSAKTKVDQIRAGLSLIGHPQGRLFLQVWLEAGGKDQQGNLQALNPGALLSLSAHPLVPYPLRTEFQHFLQNDSKPGIFKINPDREPAPISVKVDQNGLTFSANSLRHDQGLAKTALEKGLELELETNGKINIARSAKDIIANQEEATTLQPLLQLVVKLYIQEFLREFWQSQFTLNEEQKFVPLQNGTFTRSTADIVKTIVRRYGLFSEDSKLTQNLIDLIDQETKQGQGFGDLLRSYGRAKVEHWNFEKGKTSQSPAKPLETYARESSLLSDPLIEQTFHDFSVSAFAKVSSLPDESVCQGVLQSLNNHRLLKGIPVKTLKDAIATVLIKPEDKWVVGPHYPPRTEMKLIGALLEGLGFSLSAPTGQSTDSRPFIQDSAYEDKLLFEEIEYIVNERLGISTKTPDWSRKLIAAYQHQTQLFEISKIRADDQLGLLPQQGFSQWVGVIRRVDGSLAVNIDSDLFLQQWLHLEKILEGKPTIQEISVAQGESKKEVQLDAISYQGKTRSAKEIVQDFVKEDVNKRFHTIEDRLEKLQRIADRNAEQGRSLEDFFADLSSLLIDYQKFLSSEKGAATSYFHAQVKPLPITDSGMILEHAQETEQLETLFPWLDRIIQLVDQTRAPGDTFLLQSVREILENKSPAIWLDLEDLARKSTSCTEFLTSIKKEQPEFYETLVKGLYVRAHDQITTTLTDIQLKGIRRDLLDPQIGLFSDLKQTGFFETLPQEDRMRLEAVVARLQENLQDSPTKGAMPLVKTLDTLRQYLELTTPKDLLPEVLPEEGAWQYFRRTARIIKVDQQKEFDKRLAAFRAGQIYYCKLNQNLIERLASKKVDSLTLGKKQDFSLFLASRDFATVRTEGNGQEEHLEISGHYLNLSFFQNPTAQTFLAQTVLGPTEGVIATDPTSRLREDLFKYFPNAIPIHTLISQNNPTLGDLPAIPLPLAESTEFRQESTLSNTKERAAITLALFRTSKDGKMPSQEEVNQALTLTKDILKGNASLVFNYQGPLSGNYTENRLEQSTVLFVRKDFKKGVTFVSPSANSSDAAHTEANLAVRLFTGLYLGNQIYDSQQEFLFQEDRRDYGHALFRRWNQEKRAGEGPDLKSRSAEIISRMQKQCKAAPDIKLTREEEALLLDYAQRTAKGIFQKILASGTEIQTSLEEHIRQECQSQFRIDVQQFQQTAASPLGGQLGKRLLMDSTSGLANLVQGVTETVCLETLRTLSQLGFKPSKDASQNAQATQFVDQQLDMLHKQSELFLVLPLAQTDVFCLNGEILRLALDQEEGRTTKKSLRDTLAQDLQLPLLDYSDEVIAQAILFYLQDEYAISLNLKEVHDGFLEYTNTLVSALKSLKPHTFTRFAQRAKREGSATPELARQMLQIPFVVGTTLKRDPTTGQPQGDSELLLLPLAVEGTQYQLTDHGTALTQEVYPATGTAWINRGFNTAFGDYSFVENSTCSSLHDKSQILSLKIFLRSQTQRNQEVFRVENGTGIQEDPNFNASDLEAFAYFLDESKWDISKTEIRDEDIKAVRHVAQEMRRQPDKIIISGISLKLPSEEEIRVLSEKNRLAGDFCRVIRLLQRFHGMLRLQLDPDVDPTGATQAKNIQSLREANLQGPLTTWQELQRQIGHVAYGLTSITSPAEVGVSNMVTDLNIMQLKQILFKDELSRWDSLDDKTKTFLQDTTINAEFLARFLRRDELRRRLEGNAVRHFLGWFFTTDIDDDQTTFVLNQGEVRNYVPKNLSDREMAELNQLAQSDPSRLLLSIIEDWRSKEIQYSDIGWRSLNRNVGDPSDREQVAKLLLQQVIGFLKLGEGDLETQGFIESRWDKVTHSLSPPFHVMESMTQTLPKNYGKQLKSYLLQTKKLTWDQLVGKQGETLDHGLLDNTLTLPVLEKAAEEFQIFLASYEKNPLGLIRILQGQHYAIPTPQGVSSDPATNPQAYFDEIKKFGDALSTLVKEARKDPSHFEPFTMEDIGFHFDGEKRKAEEALRMLATVHIPGWSMGQEAYYNPGVQIFLQTGGVPLHRLLIRSEVAQEDKLILGENGLYLAASSQARTPTHARWGKTPAERLQKRLTHSASLTLKDWAFFRYVMHVQIKLEMELFMTFKMAKLAYAKWWKDDPMAAHALQEEIMHYFASRAGFLSYEWNFLAWTGPTIDKLMHGNWEERLQALIHFYFVEFKFAAHAAQKSFHLASIPAAELSRFAFGRDYTLYQMETSGINQRALAETVENLTSGNSFKPTYWERFKEGTVEVLKPKNLGKNLCRAFSRLLSPYSGVTWILNIPFSWIGKGIKTVVHNPVFSEVAENYRWARTTGHTATQDEILKKAMAMQKRRISCDLDASKPVISEEKLEQVFSGAGKGERVDLMIGKGGLLNMLRRRFPFFEPLVEDLAIRFKTALFEGRWIAAELQYRSLSIAIAELDVTIPKMEEQLLALKNNPPAGAAKTIATLEANLEKAKQAKIQWEKKSGKLSKSLQATQRSAFEQIPPPGPVFESPFREHPLYRQHQTQYESFYAQLKSSIDSPAPDHSLLQKIKGSIVELERTLAEYKAGNNVLGKFSNELGDISGNQQSFSEGIDILKEQISLRKKILRCAHGWTQYNYPLRNMVRSLTSAFVRAGRWSLVDHLLRPLGGYLPTDLSMVGNQHLNRPTAEEVVKATIVYFDEHHERSAQFKEKIRQAGLETEVAALAQCKFRSGGTNIPPEWQAIYNDKVTENWLFGLLEPNPGETTPAPEKVKLLRESIQDATQALQNPKARGKELQKILPDIAAKAGTNKPIPFTAYNSRLANGKPPVSSANDSLANRNGHPTPEGTTTSPILSPIDAKTGGVTISLTADDWVTLFRFTQESRSWGSNHTLETALGRQISSAVRQIWQKGFGNGAAVPTAEWTPKPVPTSSGLIPAELNTQIELFAVHVAKTNKVLIHELIEKCFRQHPQISPQEVLETVLSQVRNLLQQGQAHILGELPQTFVGRLMLIPEAQVIVNKALARAKFDPTKAALYLEEALNTLRRQTGSNGNGKASLVLGEEPVIRRALTGAVNTEIHASVETSSNPHAKAQGSAQAQGPTISDSTPHTTTSVLDDIIDPPGRHLPEKTPLTDSIRLEEDLQRAKTILEANFKITAGEGKFSWRELGKSAGGKTLGVAGGSFVFSLGRNLWEIFTDQKDLDTHERLRHFGSEWTKESAHMGGFITTEALINRTTRISQIPALALERKLLAKPLSFLPKISEAKALQVVRFARAAPFAGILIDGAVGVYDNFDKFQSNDPTLLFDAKRDVVARTVIGAGSVYASSLTSGLIAAALSTGTTGAAAGATAGVGLGASVVATGGGVIVLLAVAMGGYYTWGKFTDWRDEQTGFDNNLNFSAYQSGLPEFMARFMDREDLTDFEIGGFWGGFLPFGVDFTQKGIADPTSLSEEEYVQDRKIFLFQLGHSVWQKVLRDSGIGKVKPGFPENLNAETLQHIIKVGHDFKEKSSLPLTLSLNPQACLERLVTLTHDSAVTVEPLQDGSPPIERLSQLDHQTREKPLEEFFSQRPELRTTYQEEPSFIAGPFVDFLRSTWLPKLAGLDLALEEIQTTSSLYGTEAGLLREQMWQACQMDLETLSAILQERLDLLEQNANKDHDSSSSTEIKNLRTQLKWLEEQIKTSRSDFFARKNDLLAALEQTISSLKPFVGDSKEAEEALVLATTFIRLQLAMGSIDKLKKENVEAQSLLPHCEEGLKALELLLARPEVKGEAKEILQTWQLQIYSEMKDWGKAREVAAAMRISARDEWNLERYQRSFPNMGKIFEAAPETKHLTHVREIIQRDAKDSSLSHPITLSDNQIHSRSRAEMPAVAIKSPRGEAWQTLLSGRKVEPTANETDARTQAELDVYLKQISTPPIPELQKGPVQVAAYQKNGDSWVRESLILPEQVLFEDLKILRQTPDAPPAFVAEVEKLAKSSFGSTWQKVLHPEVGITCTKIQDTRHGQIAHYEVTLDSGLTRTNHPLDRPITGNQEILKANLAAEEKPEALSVQGLLALGTSFSTVKLAGMVEKSPEGLMKQDLEDLLKFCRNKKIEEITPKECYHYLRDEKKMDPQTLVHLVIDKSYPGRGPQGLSGIAVRTIQDRMAVLAKRAKEEETFGNIHPRTFFVEAQTFRHEVLHVQIALFRLGLLEEQSVTGLGNETSKIALARFMSIQGFSSKTMDRIFENLSEALQPKPFDAMATAREVWRTTKGLGTYVREFKKALLGLSSHQLAQVDEAIRKIENNTEHLSLTQIAQGDLSGEDLNCVNEQLKGHYRPIQTKPQMNNPNLEQLTSTTPSAVIAQTKVGP